MIYLDDDFSIDIYPLRGIDSFVDDFSIDIYPLQGIWLN